MRAHNLNCVEYIGSLKKWSGQRDSKWLGQRDSIEEQLFEVVIKMEKDEGVHWCEPEQEWECWGCWRYKSNSELAWIYFYWWNITLGYRGVQRSNE